MCHYLTNSLVCNGIITTPKTEAGTVHMQKLNTLFFAMNSIYLVSVSKSLVICPCKENVKAMPKKTNAGASLEDVIPLIIFWDSKYDIHE